MSMLEQLLQPPMGRSVSVSAENVYGRRGAGGMASPYEEDPIQADVVAIGQDRAMGKPPHPSRELGQKWKVRPCLYLAPHTNTTVLDAEGPGIIRHIWVTLNKKNLRNLIIRVFWDDEETPSVEAPVGDFFCCAPKCYADMTAIPVCVNPDNGLNCYWLMPFRRHARITIENRSDEQATFFYTINYTEEPVADNAAYFHAAFNRANPLRYGDDFVIVDNIKGQGTFAGCYLSWQQNNGDWWGEGEVKMFIDDDGEFPSICGTGTEDYICGAWGFGKRTFSSPYSGFIAGEDYEAAGTRHAMYRFHLQDPVWFHTSFKATIQALGWRSNSRYLPLQDDISATAYWYQLEPHAPLKKLGTPDDLEVI